MTQRELEEQGYTVRFHHKRLNDEVLETLETSDLRLKTDMPEALVPKFVLREEKRSIATRGGYTKAEIYKGDDLISEGETWCNPVMDNFNKKLGRDIALGRAIKNMTQKVAA